MSKRKLGCQGLALTSLVNLILEEEKKASGTEPSLGNRACLELKNIILFALYLLLLSIIRR